MVIPYIDIGSDYVHTITEKAVWSAQEKSKRKNINTCQIHIITCFIVVMCTAGCI